MHDTTRIVTQIHFDGRRWVATLVTDGRDLHYVGTFDTEEQAVRACAFVAKEL